MSYYSITTVEKFREYKMETLVQVIEEAKRLGIGKGFEYEKDDGVLGLRKYKIKNIADDFDVHCNTFMSVDAIEIKDGGNTIWRHGSGWVFDKKWIALNRLKNIDGNNNL
jgi:hypothetical protein